MGKTHNKLVRDKIPDIIIANGEVPVTRILSDQEYFKELVKKLQEECTEFTETPNVEELADIQEVVLALADTIASQQALEAARLSKADERGAFRNKLYLVRTE